MKAKPTQAGKAHEKGDVEQRHYRVKKAIDQALMLRGSREFESREAYLEFVQGIFRQLNAGRKKRLAEELTVMKPLPTFRLDDYKRLLVKVGPSSTIRVLHNTYSVNSRLIGEGVEVRAYAEYLEVWYGQKQVETIARLRGESKHAIQYRHIIEWLVRKPGAFAQYRYRQDLFPSTVFRLVYDRLKQVSPAQADRRYLGILYLAAHRGEREVEHALRHILRKGQSITPEEISRLLDEQAEKKTVLDLQVREVALSVYDTILSRKEVLVCKL